MKVNKNWFIVIAMFISVIMLISGCSDKEKEDEVDIGYSLKLEKGSYRSLLDGETSIFSLNNENVYENIYTDEIIVYYNSNSSNYVYTKDGEIFVKYQGKDIKINDKSVQELKLSSDGNYLFYFINDSYLKPVVLKLDDESKIELNNNAMISGKFIDWVSDNKLVYYGIRNDDKKSGVFTYDITDDNEELVYEISMGYISYLKALGDEVVFIEDNMENKKLLISLDKENNSREITDKILDLKDVIKIDEKIYILGKVKDGVYSIYEFLDDKLHRVVYDFPLMINLEKGLSCNKAGELLFMGSNDDYNEQNIYSYFDGSVKLVSNKSGKYTFINMN